MKTAQLGTRRFSENRTGTKCELIKRHRKKRTTCHTNATRTGRLIKPKNKQVQEGNNNGEAEVFHWPRSTLFWRQVCLGYEGTLFICVKDRSTFNQLVKAQVMSRGKAVFCGHQPGYLGKFGPTFKLRLKKKYRGAGVKRLYLSNRALPPLQKHTPHTTTHTRQLDWQGGLQACYFCSPCHLQGHADLLLQ